MSQRHVSPAVASEERRHLHESPRSGARQAIAVAIGGIAVVLAIMAGALAGYLKLEITSLKGEIARLEATQADMKAAFRALEAQSWIVDSAVSVPSPEFDRFSDFGNGGTTLPKPGNSSNAATDLPNVSPVAQNSSSYSVRVFAPSASLDKAKLQQFSNTVKASGFSIEISEDAVFQPLNPSISYRPSSVEAANKLSNALKAKFPSIHFEMRGSDAIPENLKNVLIVNLTADAFN